MAAEYSRQAEEHLWADGVRVCALDLVIASLRVEVFLREVNFLAEVDGTGLDLRPEARRASLVKMYPRNNEVRRPICKQDSLQVRASERFEAAALALNARSQAQRVEKSIETGKYDFLGPREAFLSLRRPLGELLTAKIGESRGS